MIDAYRRLFVSDPDAVLREALGLSALVVAILAGLFVPALA
ncbi:hypothetical protein [Amaricoccus sp.]|nr:hypothetical protein [Amaricoccus sp.]